MTAALVDLEQLHDSSSVGKLMHDVLAQERAVQVCTKAAIKFNIMNCSGAFFRGSSGTC